MPQTPGQPAPEQEAEARGVHETGRGNHANRGEGRGLSPAHEALVALIRKDVFTGSPAAVPPAVSLPLQAALRDEVSPTRRSVPGARGPEHRQPLGRAAPCV